MRSMVFNISLKYYLLLLGLCIYGCKSQVNKFPSPVLSVMGCGTGCRVVTEQLGPPIRMNDGWVKVRVSRTQTMVDAKNRQLSSWRNHALPSRQTIWLFANCRDNRFGSGFSSDYRNVTVENIYYNSGDPKSSTAGGNLFEQHTKLCNWFNR